MILSSLCVEKSTPLANSSYNAAMAITFSGVRPGYIRVVYRLRILFDQHDDALPGQYRRIRFFPNFCTLGNKHLHLQLHALGVLVFFKLFNDDIRRNRVGVYVKGIPTPELRSYRDRLRRSALLLATPPRTSPSVRQLQFPVVEEHLNGYDLLQRRDKVTPREHHLDFILPHGLIQQRLKLHKHDGALSPRALIHGHGQCIQVLQLTSHILCHR